MKRFAKDKVKLWLRLLLHTQDTAERTSLAFALGVFIAFLPPVPWFHTLFALLLAFVFRLNRVATLIGTYVNTPFTFLPLLAVEISAGLLVLGGEEPPELTWRQLNSVQGWKNGAMELKPFLAPLMFGCVVLGLIAAAVAYFLALRLIPIYRTKFAHLRHAHAPEEGAAPSAAGNRRSADPARGGAIMAEAPSVSAAGVDSPENNP